MEKSLLLSHLLLLPSYYNFYQQQSEKPVIRSISTSKLVIFYDTLISKLATITSSILQFLQVKKRKAGSCIRICWYFNYFL